MRHLLWIPAILAAGALLFWLSLPDTVHYRLGDETALTGDADRGEWVDGWYWSRQVAGAFAERRLGPGAAVRCRGAGKAIRSVLGDTRLYRRLKCPTRFDSVPGTRFTASVRVDNRNLATVLCHGCPADPVQRRRLLGLTDRFIELTHRAIPHYDEHGRANQAHLTQAEALRGLLERWSVGNPDDAQYRRLAETTAECVGLLVSVISAAQESLEATNVYNDCVERFGALEDQLSASFGPTV